MTSPQWTEHNWKETIAKIMRQAATDAAFRQRCLADPHGVVQEISGYALQADARLRFAEPAEGLVLTLPPLRDPASGELSDAALERVAGAGPSTMSFTHRC